jgi:hypothetical protein
MPISFSISLPARALDSDPELLPEYSIFAGKLALHELPQENLVSYSCEDPARHC